jgi:hypothetical protein
MKTRLLYQALANELGERTDRGSGSLSNTWGGARKGAGRPRSKKRCYCGKHTMARAISHRYACARKGYAPRVASPLIRS